MSKVKLVFITLIVIVLSGCVTHKSHKYPVVKSFRIVDLKNPTLIAKINSRANCYDVSVESSKVGFANVSVCVFSGNRSDCFSRSVFFGKPIPGSSRRAPMSIDFSFTIKSNGTVLIYATCSDFKPEDRDWIMTFKVRWENVTPPPPPPPPPKLPSNDRVNTTKG